MSTVMLIKGARLIVEKCVGVKPSEDVVVINDLEHRLSAEAIAGAARALGANVVVLDITPNVMRCKMAPWESIEPPRNVAALIKSSDQVIVMTAPEFSHRFSSTIAVNEAVDRGIGACNVEEGMDEWDLTSEDITEITQTTDKIISAMKNANLVHLTSAKGTDLKLSIQGRPPIRVVPIRKRGDKSWPIPLWGEATWGIIEGSAEGKVVVDGIMLGIGEKGAVVKPIEWIVREGRAVEIRGSEEADKLKLTIKRADQNATVVGEFGIGTSHKETLGSVFEKGKLGTVHLALGDNSAYPGGQNRSNVHLDGTIRDPTISVDKKLIMENGVLII